jgi:4-hydroxybenzoate polyprenyltransferase
VTAAALILAHAGHWFAGLLYLAPVLIVVGALLYQSWKDKRLGEDGDAPEGSDPEPGANRT